MSPIEKLHALSEGKVIVMSDDELDLLSKFDLSNIIRSRPNPAQVGIKDRWECWIERRDLERFKTSH